MPEQYQAMVLLAAWCALRFGELTELRRKDITLAGDVYGTVHVQRAVVRVDGGFQVTTPKSDAGQRDVEIPPHLIPAIHDHLDRFVGKGKDALLFPAAHGEHLAPASLYRKFYKARAAANRDDLPWHDLRHSGACAGRCDRGHVGGADGTVGSFHASCRDALPARRPGPRPRDRRPVVEAGSKQVARNSGLRGDACAHARALGTAWATTQPRWTAWRRPKLSAFRADSLYA